MNWDQIEGKWKQMKGTLRDKWGKLTDDDLERIGGNKDKLVGALQERYGWERDQAERESENWARDYDDMNTGTKRGAA
jgi:uncharacterized protein YjbJ (UPF0337 family)